MSMLLYFILTLVFSFFILIIFFLFSFKDSKSNQQNSIFECGFTSYFFSRISVSIHYFMIAVIFLFLDLEMCYSIPMFFEGGQNMYNKNIILILFIGALLMTLFYEWVKKNLEWKY